MVFLIKVSLTKRLAPVSKNLDKALEGYVREIFAVAWQGLSRRLQDVSQTGNLKNSIRQKLEPMKGVIFKTNKITKDGEQVDNYFWFVENDTKAHVISPKSGNGLIVFNLGLFTIFATYPTKDGIQGVQHTGTKGQHMLRDSIDEARQDKQRIFKKHIRNIANV